MTSTIILGEYEYIKPTSDRAIRKLLTSMEGSDESTRSFVNAVIFPNDTDAQVKQVTFLVPDVFGEDKESRSFVLDAKFKDEQNRLFNIEMQNVDDGSWRERFMLSLSGMYFGQLVSGQNCKETKKIYSIQLINFEIAKNHEKYHHTFRQSTTEPPYMIYSNKDVEIHVIELSKFKKSLDELETSLDKWLYFHTTMTKHRLNEAIPEILQTPIGLAIACRNLRHMSLNKEDRARYCSWLQEMYDAEGLLQRGIDIGEERGELKLLADQILYKFGGVSREEVFSMIEKLNLNAEQTLALGRKILKAKSLKELLRSQPHESQETTLRRSPRKRTRREIVAM
jgi:predicted transposase/invertase (TIGR01784 family)